jgi:HEPN domain-containing protein
MTPGEARKETCEELLEAAREVAETCEDVSAKV